MRIALEDSIPMSQGVIICVSVPVIERGSSMLEVSYTVEGEWSVIYRMEGVRCTEVLTKDQAIALREIQQKMNLLRGLTKGKVFLTKPGRDI